jgi:colanic acid/amylovoran biosynthesis glycosyltransferase
MTRAPEPNSSDLQAVHDAPALAYLTSQYPMLSMIFVLREVTELRRLGFRVDTASVNPADRRPEDMTVEERVEMAETYCLKAHGVPGAAAAHASSVARNLRGYLRGWRLVLKLSGLDLRRLAFNIAFFTEALMVGRWMRSRGLRHLHVHLASQPATVGMFAKRVFGCGFSMTVHGPDEFYDAAGQYLREKVLAANFICCISHFARSQLMKVSPYEHWEKLVVCRLGVDPNLFHAQAPRDAGDTFRVLCVGRLTPAKGQHLLIEAASRIATTGRQIHVQVVGAGVDRESLEQHADRLGARHNVTFEGAVSQDRIREFYAAADCFCIPSFAEGIPVVLMEAMAMEVACVTTHITGIPELIRDRVDGLLVAPSDLDGLVNALISLIDDPQLRRAVAAGGRKRVLQHFDLAANVEALARVFKSRVPLAERATSP